MLHRILRIQKEKEELERKQLEAIMKREQKRQELIREKEREVLQLQVECSFILLLILS